MGLKDFDTKKYLEELFGGAADIDAEKRRIAEEVLADERVAPKLAETVLMRSDYSRTSNRVLQREKELLAKEQEMENWYRQQLEVTRENAAEYERMKARVSELEAGADSTGGKEPVMPKATYLTAEDYQRDIYQREMAAVDFAAKLQSISNRHQYEFGEPLDTEAVKDAAVKARVPIQVAYDQFVAPKRQEASEAKIKRMVEEAEERGRKAAIAGSRLPMSPSDGGEVHPLEANRALLGSRNSATPAPMWKRGAADFHDGTLVK